MATLLSTTIDGSITEKLGDNPTSELQPGLTSSSLGSTVAYQTANTVVYCTAAYDVNADKYVIAYRDDTHGGVGKAVVGTPSGETITWGTPVTFSGQTTSGATAEIGFAMSYDIAAQKVLICWFEGTLGSAGGKGASKVGTVSGTGTGGTISFGAEAEFETAAYPPFHRSFSEHIVYDSNAQKHVIIWEELIQVQAQKGEQQ